MTAPASQDKVAENGEHTRRRRWYARKSFWFSLGGLFVIGIVVVGYWYFFLRGYVSTDDAYIHGNSVSISAKMLGRIVSLSVDEGDSVSQGQVLVMLDSTDLKAQEAQAQSAIETAQKSVDLARVGVQRATDDFNRAAIQYKSGVITQEEFQHSQQALEEAQATLQLSLARVTAAQSQLAVVETQLSNTKVYAPFSGIVARRWTIVGDVVQPSQPIFAVYESSNVWVVADFEETKLTSIHVGDTAQLTVDAYPGKKFEGNVLFIGAAAASQFSLIPPNNASGNFTKVTQRVPVRLSIREIDRTGSTELARLLPGMSVVVTINVNQNKHKN